VIVTVDGPGGSGKSTVSRALARRLGLSYLNSGYIYRAVTVLVLDDAGETGTAVFDDSSRVERIIAGMQLRFRDDESTLRVFSGDRDITARVKAPDVTPQIWRIANNGAYRRILVDLQRRFAAPPGVVAEGRDMGTVIFPEAEFKFYLDASPEERARRQLRDLEAAGHRRSFAELLADVLERDRHDRQRAEAPLRVPPGAEVILTDSLRVEEVVERMLNRIKAPADPAAEGRRG
jgi:cytidylate kinase